MTIRSDVVARPDSTYPVIIKPYKLDISQFGEKVRDEMKFTITNVSDEDLNIDLVSLPSHIAMVELPSKVEAGKSASGTLKLTSEGVEEQFEKSFTIQLSDEQNSRFTIPIKRKIRNPKGGPASTASSQAGDDH